jgi:ADP-ribose pyrophosphatase
VGDKLQVIHRGRLIDVGIETARLPNGREIELEVVRHPGGAVVVALNARGEVCLLRQYRHAVNQPRLWELPAGRIDESDVTPAETAVRELREEAGFVAARWSGLGSVLPSPGFCDERLHLFLAEDLMHVGSGHQDDEYIEVHWLPLNRAVAMAAAGEIEDAKTVAGLFRADFHLKHSAGP